MTGWREQKHQAQKAEDVFHEKWGVYWLDHHAVLVTQWCPTLGNPMACSPPGSSVHRILQARILEWVVISFSRGSSWPRDQTQVSLQTESLPSEPPGKHHFKGNAQTFLRRLVTLAFSFTPSNLPPAAAKSLHSCPTLCDLIDSSPPGSPVPGILQAWILEWVVEKWKWSRSVLFDSERPHGLQPTGLLCP